MTILSAQVGNICYYYEQTGASVSGVLPLIGLDYDFKKVFIQFVIGNYRNLILMQDYKELLFSIRVTFPLNYTRSAVNV